jgi:hypothetical protein
MTRHNLDEQLSWLLTNAGLLIPKLPKCIAEDQHQPTRANTLSFPSSPEPSSRPATHPPRRVLGDSNGLFSKIPREHAVSDPRPSSLSTCSKLLSTDTSRQASAPASGVVLSQTFKEALKNGMPFPIPQEGLTTDARWNSRCPKVAEDPRIC